jgi:hypothetical protein
MKECENVGNLFGELHGSNLDAETEKIVREHLHVCTPCREDYKWYGFTIQALASLDRVSPPEDFVDQLRSKLYSTPPSSSYLDFLKNFFSTVPSLPLPVGVTAVVFLVAMGFVVYNQAPIGLATSSVAMRSAYDPTDQATPGYPKNVTGQSSAERIASLPISKDSNKPSAFPKIPLNQLAMTMPIHPEASMASFKLTPTVADRIGADNLTVESRSINQAVQSVKQILPEIRGSLVEEMNRGGFNEILLGVRIPPLAYGNLTTELINHGAVQVGAGSDPFPPAPSKTEDNNVVLYIRFVPSR